MNIEQLRLKFPIFRQEVNGYPFIYFDSAATAQVPTEVVDAISEYYLTYKANIGRGIYSYGEDATHAYEVARAKIASFIGARQEQILFTSGATESINIVARSWALHKLQKGDEIIVSAVEHNSNFVPWYEVALQLGCVVKIVSVTHHGVIDYDDFKKKLSSKTKLVAIVHTSNVVGGTNDIKRIARMAHDVGAVVLVDASQSIAHQAIDVQDMDCDFLVFSGHKLYGPTGIGVLYSNVDCIKQMKPSCFGGGMVLSVGSDLVQYKLYPHGFEAGTPNVAGAIGLGAAIDFMQSNIDFDELKKHETSLVQLMLQGLAQIADIAVLSANPDHVNLHMHLVTFVSKKYHAHDIAAYLDKYGIAVRAGNHCVQMRDEKSTVVASVRISFAVYNTEQEVAFFLKMLKQLFV